MPESGQLLEVKWEWDGTEVLTAASAGAGTVTLLDIDSISETETIWIGSASYAVTGRDDALDTISISPGLAAAVEEGDPVVPDSGGAPAQVWVAVVVVPDAEEPIEVPLTIKDLSVMPEGTYNPPKAIVLDDDLQRVIDLPGTLPVISGGYIPPSTLPSSTPTEQPAQSPDITATGMSDAIMLKADPVVPGTLIEYHMSTTQGFTPTPGDPATLIDAATQSTILVVKTGPDGQPLVPETLYYFRAIATNSAPGTPPPASPEVSTDLDPDMLTQLAVAEAVLGLVMAGAIEVSQITIDPDTGITIPQPDGGVIHFPANGVDVATITAYIVARGLTLTGDASLQGLVQVFQQFVISSGVTAPTQLGSFSAHYPVITTDAAAAPWVSGYHGLALDASGTTWVTALALFGGTAERYDIATGDFVAGFPLAAGFNPVGGVTRIGTNFYFLGFDTNRGNDFYVYVYNSSFVKTGEFFAWAGGAVPKWPAIGNDGSGNILIAFSRPNGDLRIREYSGVTSTITTNYDLTGIGTATYDLGFVGKFAGGSGAGGDFPAARFVVATKANNTFVMTTAATPIRQPTNEWPRAGATWVQGMMHDGTRFWHLDANGRLWKYAGGTSAAAQTVYGAHSNYDGDTNAGGFAGGTPSDGIAFTHETQVGPIATFSRPSKSFLKYVAPAAIEANITDPTKTDKANRTRVYMSITSGSTNLRLQDSMAVGVNSTIVETLATGTKAPETANGFAGITAAASLESGGSDGSGPLAQILGTGFALFRYGSWANLTLTNGWTNSAGNELSWWKDSSGNVHVRGIILPGTSGQSAATLPTGARPAKQLRKSIEVLPTASATARVIIGSDGTLTPTLNTGTPTQYYMEFEFPTQA